MYIFMGICTQTGGEYVDVPPNMVFYGNIQSPTPNEDNDEDVGW